MTHILGGLLNQNHIDSNHAFSAEISHFRCPIKFLVNLSILDQTQNHLVLCCSQIIHRGQKYLFCFNVALNQSLINQPKIIFLSVKCTVDSHQLMFMLSWQIHHHQEQQHQQHQQHGGLTSVDVHAGKSTTGSQSCALETLALADGTLDLASSQTRVLFIYLQSQKPHRILKLVAHIFSCIRSWKPSQRKSVNWSYWRF